MGARSPWVSARSMLDATRRQIDRLHIKVGDPGDEVGSLSGGNQQKVVLGRWLEVEPRLLLLDDPTRGVDVGAKHEIYLLIRRLAEEGRVVLFRSTELPELVGLADRILVFYRGRLSLDLDAAAVDDHERAARHQHRLARRARAGACRTRWHGSQGGNPMIRRAFTMRLKPGGLAEYKRHHDAIWPELVAEIEQQGIAQITIFENDPLLFLYSRDHRRGGLGPALAHARSTTAGARS